MMLLPSSFKDIADVADFFNLGLVERAKEIITMTARAITSILN